MVSITPPPRAVEPAHDIGDCGIAAVLNDKEFRRRLFEAGQEGRQGPLQQVESAAACQTHRIGLHRAFGLSTRRRGRGQIPPISGRSGLSQEAASVCRMRGHRRDRRAP